MRNLDHSLRDLSRSIALGPGKFIVPMIGYAILYPTILATNGQRVLGLWALLASLLSILNVFDLGFSAYLRKAISVSRSEERRLATARRIISLSSRVYFMAGGALCGALIIVWLLMPADAGGIPQLYPPAGLYLAVLVTIISAVLQLHLKLVGAFLAAVQENYYVEAVSAATPLLIFPTAILGAYKGHPLEFLAIGYFLGGVVALVLLSRRLRYLIQLPALRLLSARRISIRRFFRLWSQSRDFYMVSMGFAVRDPAYRFVSAGVLGLEFAAWIDVALRLTTTLRNVVASGTAVLFPILAKLSSKGLYAEAISVSRVSLSYLVSFVASSQLLIIVFQVELYSAWLNDTSEFLLLATVVFAVWNTTVAANAPFWHLLMATGKERFAAASLWGHTGIVLILFPLNLIIELEPSDLLACWAGGALITQILIYYVAEKTMGAISKILHEKYVLGVVALMLLCSIFVVTRSVGADIDAPIDWVSATLSIVFFLTGVYVTFQLWKSAKFLAEMS